MNFDEFTKFIEVNNLRICYSSDVNYISHNPLHEYFSQSLKRSAPLKTWPLTIADVGSEIFITGVGIVPALAMFKLWDQGSLKLGLRQLSGVRCRAICAVTRHVPFQERGDMV